MKPVILLVISCTPKEGSRSWRSGSTNWWGNTSTMGSRMRTGVLLSKVGRGYEGTLAYSLGPR